MEATHFQLLPPLSDEEYAALKADIRTSGVLVPVEYDETGTVLDGHHRVRAWSELRAEGVSVPDFPRLTRIGLSEAQKRSHARKLNLMRRHLNTAQKREVIREQLRETPEISDRQIATLLGVDHKTVGSTRGDLESIGEIPQSDRQTSDGRTYPRERAVPEPTPTYTPAIFASNAREHAAAITFAGEMSPTEAQTTATITDVRRGAMARQREAQQARAEAIDFSATGKYRVIYADPPWQYGNHMPEYFTEQADHYPLMTIPQIAAMPVIDIAEDNAVLFLWVTSPILYDAAQVITSWGFTYKASFVWDKVKHNMGHYNSVRHEFLLVCVRGSCQPDVQKLFDSVQSIERTNRHSEKPQAFRDIIDTIYSNGRKIELFARSEHEGWERYGNEVMQ